MHSFAFVLFGKKRAGSGLRLIMIVLADITTTALYSDIIRHYTKLIRAAATICLVSLSWRGHCTLH